MSDRSVLLRKYPLSGPRYTSYPTVPSWTTSPSAEQWLTGLVDTLRGSTRAQGSGLSLYVHIPFCESLCTFCGCNTRITRNYGVGLPYVQTVLQEWAIYRERFREAGWGEGMLPLSSLHLGGGTPTFLSGEEIQVLIEGLLKTVALQPGEGFSIEADPRKTSRAQLTTLYQLGFRQLSLGVQDFDPHVQETVNRVQSVEEVEELTLRAREIGFKSITYDLIYGLPFQTQDAIDFTLNEVTRLRPDRVAYYGYAHVPWIKPGQRRFTEEDLPTGDFKRELYIMGRETLMKAGYREIGMDHYVLESDSLWLAAQAGTLDRNFVGYHSRRASPLIGLGVSAMSDAWTIYSQNEKLLETYLARVEAGQLPLLRGHILSAEDLALRTHILELMTRFFTKWLLDSPAARFLARVPEQLSKLAQDQLVILENQSCKVTERGRPFLKNICMAFDAHVKWP